MATNNSSTNYPQGNRGIGVQALKERLAEADRARQQRLDAIRKKGN